MIFQRLKDHFVPHPGNGHRPRFLRAETMRTVAIVAILFELVAFLLPTLSFVSLVDRNLASVLPTVLGTLTNAERGDLELPELQDNPVLDLAARLKAEDMAAKGYFAHESPEGRTPWYWLDLVGYQYDYAGENLAINFKDSEDVTDAWMNSPGHRANIAKADYTEIGTGIATGMYEGRETVFVAQVYGKPKTVPAATPAPEPKPEPVPAEVATPTAPQEEPETPTVRPNPTPAPAPEPEPAASPASSTDGTATTAVTTSVAAAAPESMPDGEQLASTRQAGMLARIAASPHQATDTVFMILMAVIIAAVVVTIAVRFDIQHPDLVANGLGVVAVIGAILILNGYVATSRIRTSSVEYEDAPATVSLL